MKTNKFLSILSILVMALCTMNSFCSCSSDDDKNNPDSGIKGWYVDKSSLAKSSDFIKINSAINSGEILWQFRTTKVVATKSLFIQSDGAYTDSDATFGKLRFSVNNFITVYRIIDDNSIARYDGQLYETNASGSRGKEKLYTFNAGSIFGSLTYYGSPTYYTYVRTDNKIVTTNGDVFTITSTGGLIKDGTSTNLSKYNPNE